MFWNCQIGHLELTLHPDTCKAEKKIQEHRKILLQDHAAQTKVLIEWTGSFLLALAYGFLASHTMSLLFWRITTVFWTKKNGKEKSTLHKEYKNCHSDVITLKFASTGTYLSEMLYSTNQIVKFHWIQWLNCSALGLN